MGRWLQAGVLRVGVTGLAAGRRGAGPANAPGDGSSSSVSGGAGVTAALRSVFGRSGQRSRSAEPRCVALLLRRVVRRVVAPTRLSVLWSGACGEQV